MNRRAFLKLIGWGVAGVVVAPSLPAEDIYAWVDASLESHLAKSQILYLSGSLAAKIAQAWDHLLLYGDDQDNQAFAGLEGVITCK